MTQEERELLKKDLSSRLPYNTKVNMVDTEDNTVIIDELDQLTYGYVYYDVKKYIIMPYLRKMSSMTEDECMQYNKLKYIFTYTDKDGNIFEQRFDTIESFDYLNSIHIDYRGLIQKGIAFEATSGMYS